MNKRTTIVTLLVLVVLCLSMWIYHDSHPYAYDARYFTSDMQQRFSSYSNVVDTLADGWKDGENPDWEELNAAFGYDLQDAWQGGSPYPDGIPSLKEIIIWPSERFVFLRYDAQGGGWYLAKRRKRWIVYPITRWIELVSASHTISMKKFSGHKVEMDGSQSQTENMESRPAPTPKSRGE